MKKNLYLIDGHALCYRAYYAFINSPLTNSKGQNTSAIYGFAKMLLKLIEEQNVDYLAVAFDPLKKSFRFDVYPEYKANRAKMPDDLRSQIEEIKNMVTVLGIPVIIQEGYEADDVMGTVANKFASPEMTVFLVTGDKDAYQLLNENVRIYANTKGISEYTIYDEKTVVEKLGIPPSSMVDYLAMIGDASDNIPGIKGIGPKSAQKLIIEFGSLDGVYQNIGEIKGKQKDLISAGKDSAYLSKDLATIRRDIHLDFDLENAEFKGIDKDTARKYFMDLEMISIAEEFREAAGSSEAEESNAEKKEYIIIRDEKTLVDACGKIKKAGLVSVDTETTSTNPVDAEMVGMSFSIKENHGWYVPVTTGSLFSDREVGIDKHTSLDLVKKILTDPEIKKVGQNIKYDYIIFKNEGIEIANIFFDTMVASYLLDPSERRHNMDDMAMHYLKYKTTTYDELVGKGKKALHITEVPLNELADYAIEDTDITLRLYNVLKEKIREQKLEKLYLDVELPLIKVLAEMELAGVKIDTAYFRELRMENEIMLKNTEDDIYKAAGIKFNINSTKELSVILFEKLGLKPVRKTKTGFSTDINVLEELKGQHPIIEKLITYRTLSKLKNTYIDSLPELISPKTGRIHTSYNQTVVATGRLSSSDPNLQNIPARDEFGKKIRKGFVAEKGFTIMSADYSQIELRLAAHMSGDPNMKKAFLEGIDIHSMTASSVFGVDINNVPADLRRQAKIINFSTIYGVSPFGLSQQVDISVHEAKIFIDKYFEAYPGFKDYMERTIAFAREKGFVQTLLGRKRPIPDINSSVHFRKEGAERMAINTPIQGTSADMIKVAMINIHREMLENKMKSRMIMQVHDELVFEVHSSEKETMEKMVRDKMENALKLDVPIVVDTGFGDNWEEAH